MKAIEVKQLTKRFGTFTAVDHISFEVEPGEIFGFLGANGAGKTTAMRMLCGLSVPTSGEARVAGFDVYRESESIKRNIGYMSQKFSLYGDLKVWENIRLYGGIYGLSEKQLKAKTDELLRVLDLENERNTLVDALPLGWKQKLAFSVAIIHEPGHVRDGVVQQKVRAGRIAGRLNRESLVQIGGAGGIERDEVPARPVGMIARHAPRGCLCGSQHGRREGFGHAELGADCGQPFTQQAIRITHGSHWPRANPPLPTCQAMPQWAR
mgnify:CR=1 FL=1